LLQAITSIVMHDENTHNARPGLQQQAPQGVATDPPVPA